MEITLKVKQSEILDEVARTTSYTGAKKDDDANAYERISTVDEDKEELMRFWYETRAVVAQTFIRLLKTEGMAEDNDTYELTLKVSTSFDTSLIEGMQNGLFSYFVQSITGKWYKYTNRGEVERYEADGKKTLEEVREKAYYKASPQRPTYN